MNDSNPHNPYDESDLIGYSNGGDGYLYPIYNVKPGSVTTKAFILCSECNGAISNVGGPNHDALCLTCFGKRLKPHDS